MFLRFQKFFFVFLLTAWVVDFGIPFSIPKVLAQNNADCVLFGANGQGTIAPQTYGELVPCNPSPSPTPTPPPNTNPINTPVTTPKPVTKTNLFDVEASTSEKKISLSGLLNKKLRLEYSGVGKTCQAGTLEAIPWTLTDGGIGIENAEMFSIVAKQALEADHRLRRISINESKIDLYYLEPARIFGFIPVNYTFHISADVNSYQFKLENPKWLKFATHSHNEITQTVSNSLFDSFNQERLNFLADKNIFIKHAHVIEQTALAFQGVIIYPFSNSFWICVFVPYFILFLVLLGIIIGIIWYFLSKKKKEKYIKKINREYSDDTEDKTPYQPRFKRQPEEDTETLEDYMKSKRFEK